MVDLTSIKERLNSKAMLTQAEQDCLRELLQEVDTAKADAAVFLLYKFPIESKVTIKDRDLLEEAFDSTLSTYGRALALSLLCNWLSLREREVQRLLIGITDRTDETDFLCIKACSLVAQVLANVSEPRLARALLDVFRDETRLPGTKAAGRDALLSLDGMNVRDIMLSGRTDPSGLWKRAELVANRLEAEIAAHGHQSPGGTSHDDR